jgi:hypothetical protein
MNIDTGKVISQAEYNALSTDEKARYINIQRAKQEELAKLSARGRLEFERNQRVHVNKEIAKRRLATKRSAKARAIRKRKNK